MVCFGLGPNYCGLFWFGGFGWRVWGGGFGVEGLGWMVWGGGFGVEGLVCGVWGFGFRVLVPPSACVVNRLFAS